MDSKPPTGDQFGYEVVVTSNIEDVISSSEKALSRWFSSLTSFSRKAKKPLDDVATASSKFTDAADKASSKYALLASGKEKLLNLLRNENSELKSSTHNWRTLGGILAGATVVGTITSMVKEFLDLSGAVKDLNTAAYGQAEAIKVASKYMHGYGRTLGASREELQSLAKVGLSANVYARDGAKAYGEWADASIVFARATGMSGEAIADFNYRLSSLYKLGTQPLRSIGSAMAFVAFNSNASAEQLTGFIGSLEPFYRNLGEMSGNARAKMTEDFLSVAGTLSEVGVDANKFSGMFNKMIKTFEGADLRASIGQLLGSTQDEVLEDLKKGGAPGLIKQLAISLAKITDPVDLERYFEAHRDNIGLELEDFRALAVLGKQQGKAFDDLQEKTQKAARRRAYLDDAAKARLTNVQMTFNKLRVAFEDVFVKFGEKFVALADGPLQTFADKIISMVEWLSSPEGIQRVSQFFGMLEKTVSAVGGAVSFLADAWKGLSSGWQKFVLVGGGVLLFSKQLLGVFGLLHGGVGLLTRSIGALSSLGGTVGSMGAAGPLRSLLAAGAGGYAIGTAIDQAGGFSDKLSSMMVNGQRDAASGRVQAHAGAGLMSSASEMLAGLVRVAATSGSISDGGRRIQVTQDLARERLGSFFDRTGARAEDRDAVLRRLESTITSLPKEAALKMPKAGATEGALVRNQAPAMVAPPVVNVTTGASSVVEAVERQTQVMVQVRDYVAGQNASRRNIGHRVAVDAIGG